MGTLLIVGTPIGNLADLSARARETLASVEVIAAEDTRRTGRLLKSLGIESARLVSFFEGNEVDRTEELLARLREGASVAVVSDGGMPAISDPGFQLVRACAQEGIAVRVVPGPSAAIAALVVSGFPTDRFVFEGFFPRRAGERSRRIAELADEPRTIVVFESPRRVRSLLREIQASLGDRRVAVARELTKLHEDVMRGAASEVLSTLGAGDPRGEVVVVIEGAPPVPGDLAAAVEEAAALASSGLKLRIAAAQAAARHGVSANDLYDAMLGR